MSGTVNIARDIWHDTAFKRQPFTEREAFVWLIMEASYKAREKRVGSVCVRLDRGQLASSIRFMAEAWDWQKSTVDRFLKRLQNRDMIGTDSGTGLTVITICKYDEYQSKPRENGTDETEKRDSSGTAAGQQRDKPNKGLIPDEISEQEEDMGKPISPADKPPAKARMPVGWMLSDEGWAYARSQGIPDKVIEDEARGFQAYWADRRDRDASKSERGWEQCWANRCRSIAGRYAGRIVASGPASGRYGQGSSIASIVARRRASSEI